MQSRGVLALGASPPPVPARARRRARAHLVEEDLVVNLLLHLAL